MANYARNQAEAVQFSTRILCDIFPPEPLDACYIVGETEENQDSNITEAFDCYSKGLCKAIILLDGHTRDGYSGTDYVRRRLNEKGFLGQIIDSKLPGDSLNTYTEAVALINLIKDMGIKSLGVIAPDFHLVRAFTTIVSFAVKSYPGLKIYARRGKPLPWKDSVRHSQGTLVGTRLSLLLGEWTRMGLYSEKGDLLSADEILEYMDKRDR